MTEAKTRPISFRVPVEILDRLTAAGVSPVEIARDALAREAIRQRQRAVLRRLREDPIDLELGVDAADFIRRDRDTHA